MKILKGIEEIPEFPARAAVAIGNFDGVHLGHKRILETLIEEAQNKELISVALTFSPHPKKVVGREPIEMIQSMEQRLATLSRYQIQAALILHFDKQLADLSAREFIQKVVLKPLRAAEIIVGENFCFGKNRQGCSDTLYNLAKSKKFQVHIIPPVTIEGITVSSSLIRNLLQAGQIEKANVLLGRPYEIEGTVIQGQCRGKNLGFPTANMKTQNKILPEGVFLSNTVVGGAAYASLTNIGHSPTFSQAGKNVESYILNFKDDIYGHKISVRFLKKIREEKKFSSVRDLSIQIGKDLVLAKDYFKIR